MAQEKSKVWYKEPWPWLLFSGPAIVVVAAFVTLYLAASGSSDLVSDDYYKDGKHIDLDLKRDTAAVERGIRGQALINPDGSAVRVYVSGRFDDKVPLKLTLLHPVKKEYDQSIGLRRKRVIRPNISDSSPSCRRPTIGMCGWKTKAGFGGWKTNGLSARAHRLI